MQGSNKVMKGLNTYRGLITYLGLVVIMGLTAVSLNAQEGFRVWPYLQHPASDAMTILWFSEEKNPGELLWEKQGSALQMRVNSRPEASEALEYSRWEDSTFYGGEAPSYPFRHRVRLEGLEAATTYAYTVSQGAESFSSFFRTAPGGNEALRFIVYGDSETEPESTGNFTAWPDPLSSTSRIYLVDQTTGYRNNLEVIRSRRPNLVLIAGDLTQHGGEQRDWDEFWMHNTDSVSSMNLAGQVPLIATPGNHDYYEGTFLGRYNQPGSERAIRRYLTYFETAENQSPIVEQEGRYYSFQYGPATFIILDLCNNGINGSEEDTNYYLLGESDPEGGHAPDFGIGSIQYKWLEERLRESQENSLFTFVMGHQAPYSSGPHGFPAGIGDLLDNLSGVPTRLLTQLFMRYGVDAVFSGHDEMWERSEISGLELLPDGTEVNHSIPFFDVGIGGDGLRGPVEGIDNIYQQFLVHTDVSEVWEEGILVSGGKHYGHLEVDIYPVDEYTWKAVLTPAYVFPLYNEEDSCYSGFERREYNDKIILTRSVEDPALPVANHSGPINHAWNYPNPFSIQTTIEYRLSEASKVKVSISDVGGRLLRILQNDSEITGSHSIVWDGKDNTGMKVTPGFYFYHIETNSGHMHSGKMVVIKQGKD